MSIHITKKGARIRATGKDAQALLDALTTQPPKPQRLQVWHTSDFGRDAFTVDVTSVDEAIRLLRILADYDLYQGERVDVNAQGLNVWDDQAEEWTEYYDEEGRDVDEIAAEMEGGAK